MKTIEVKNQAEFDKLPDEFADETLIKITGAVTVKKNKRNASVVAWGSASVVVRESASVVARGSASVEAFGSASVEAWGSASVVAWESARVVVRGSARVVARGSARVVAWESARVVVRGSASVEARGSASVEARGSASVVAWGSASVEAWGSTSVEAFGSASVVAWESASVEARGSARVVARGSARVVAWESASVVAWESASVVARGSASVEARGNSIVRALSSRCKIVARKFSVVIAVGCSLKVERDATTHYIETPQADYELYDFCSTYNVARDGNYLILYKIVKDDLTDFYSGKIKYEIGQTVTAPDWNPDNKHECGGGLHLSPSAELAAKFHNPGVVLKCRVSADDIVVHPKPDYPHKVRCRAVQVLERVEVPK